MFKGTEGTVPKSWPILKLLIQRELKIKYRGSVLGYCWSMLNPLLFMVILSIVFSHLVRGIEHYELFVLSGVLFWNMTSHTLIGGTTSLVNNSSLLLKVKTPFWTFALVPLGSAVSNLILALIPYLIIALAKGVTIPWTLVFLPLVLFVYALFLAGLVLFLSTMNVFFRDVAHVMEPIIQILFYSTPIIYDRTNPSLPPIVGFVIGLNPFAHFVELFRSVLFKAQELPLTSYAILAGLCTVSLTVGIWTYNANRNKVAFKL